MESKTPFAKKSNVALVSPRKTPNHVQIISLVNILKISTSCALKPETIDEFGGKHTAYNILHKTEISNTYRLKF